MKNEFLGKLNAFVSVLVNAKATISNLAELSEFEGFDVKNYITPFQILGAASNSEVIDTVERKMMQWAAEIEQVSNMLH